jgi:hypothetical protein
MKLMAKAALVVIQNFVIKEQFGGLEEIGTAVCCLVDGLFRADEPSAE